MVAGKPVTDRETGSHWDIAGRGVDGALQGWTLAWVDSTQVKWFAWAAEHPETSVYPIKPFKIVIAEAGQANAKGIAGWKKEGFRALALVLDEQHEAAVFQKA